MDDADLPVYEIKAYKDARTTSITPFGIFIVDFEHIPHILLVFLLNVCWNTNQKRKHVGVMTGWCHGNIFHF